MKTNDYANSVKEARERLKCGHTKIYELFKRGELKARKLHGRTIVLESDLIAFMRTLPCAASPETTRPADPELAPPQALRRRRPRRPDRA